jgi:DNA-binding response OmpR family regulator
MMKHILVVDDEENILTLFEDELSEADYRVSTATTGSAALETIAAEVPDLIVLDIRMPDMHGLEVLAKVRENHKDLPVILCTAVHGLKDEYTVWDARVSAYLTKPIDLDDLVYKVQEVLEKNESTSREA